MSAVGVMLCVTFLAFARVPSTVVGLDLTATGLSLRIAGGPTVLHDPMEVGYVGVLTPASVSLPGDASAPAMELDAAALFLSVAADTGGGTTGRLRLEGVTVPPGASVTLEAAGESGEPDRYELEILGGVQELRVLAMGAVRVRATGGRDESRAYGSARVVGLRPTGDTLRLEVRLPENTVARLSPQLPVDSLDLFRANLRTESGAVARRAVSTVTGGDLYLEALGGRRVGLRQDQNLRFSSIEGVLRRVELTGGGVELDYYGGVRGMTTGSLEYRRSLMPTWLEWIRAQDGWIVMWGVLVYLLGLARGVIALWGPGKES